MNEQPEVPTTTPSKEAPGSELREPCHLFKLPAELRLDIYHRVFADVRMVQDDDDIDPIAAILGTCREIFKDATPTFQSYIRSRINKLENFIAYLESNYPDGGISWVDWGIENLKNRRYRLVAMHTHLNALLHRL